MVEKYKKAICRVLDRSKLSTLDKWKLLGEIMGQLEVVMEEEVIKKEVMKEEVMKKEEKSTKIEEEFRVHCLVGGHRRDSEIT